jgi:hypothetical protein
LVIDQDADIRTCSATSNHLIIALHVGGNEDYLGSEAIPRFFEQFHSIWSSSSFLRVPENHSLGLDVFVDQTRYRWPKGFLLIRTYPNEKPNQKSEKVSKEEFESSVPIGALDAGGQRCPDTGSSADADSSFEHRGCMSNTSCCLLADDHFGNKKMSIPNFSSLVQTALGGSTTRLFVKSP